MSEAIGGNAQEHLRSFAERIVRLDQEVKDAMEEHVAPIKEQIKDVFSEAAADGFDRKALREAIKRTTMDENLRAEIEAYEAALLEHILS